MSFLFVYNWFTVVSVVLELKKHFMDSFLKTTHPKMEKSTPGDVAVIGEDVSEHVQWCNSKVGVE